MNEEKKYSEEELEQMADALLGEMEEDAAPAKKKNAKKKDKEPEAPVKTPEERLQELLDKGKRPASSTPRSWSCWKS